MFPVPVPIRRSALSLEGAVTISVLGGALVLLQVFLGFFESSLFTPGVLVGLLILAAAATASFRPRHREAMGGALVLLAFLSLIAGGGFYLGALLVAVGGIFLVLTRGEGRAARGSAHSFGKAMGPPCARCGRHVPSWSSRCPYCGFPESE